MTTRCLRICSPVLRFLRYASSTAGQDASAVRSRTTSRTRFVGTGSKSAIDTKGGQRPGWTSTLLKATYEPSPIFGTVKPTQKEALKKPTPEMQKSKGKPKAAEKNTTKGPEREDEKKV